MEVGPLVPQLIGFEREWTQNVPTSWPEAGEYLTPIIGYNFPILAKIRQSRVIMSVSTIIAHNMDPNKTVLGLKEKALVGLVFGYFTGNQQFIEANQTIAKHFQVNENEINEIEAFVKNGI